MGADDAPLAAVIFSDYQCPYCASLSLVVRSWLTQHDNSAVGYRHLPLRIHPFSREAALAAICATAQGAFEEMHTLLFHAEWTDDATDWARAARTAELKDVEGFLRCLSDQTAHEKLDADLRTAAALEIRGTPTIVTRRQIVQGSVSISTLEAILKSR